MALELDEFGRIPVSPGLKKEIASSLASLRPDERGAFILVTDAGDRAIYGHFAANINGTWKVAAGGRVQVAERRATATGFVAIAGHW
jgi:hypothetical protein